MTIEEKIHHWLLDVLLQGNCKSLKGYFGDHCYVFVSALPNVSFLDHFGVKMIKGMLVSKLNLHMAKASFNSLQ